MTSLPVPPTDLTGDDEDAAISSPGSHPDASVEANDAKPEWSQAGVTALVKDFIDKYRPDVAPDGDVPWRRRLSAVRAFTAIPDRFDGNEAANDWLGGNAGIDPSVLADLCLILTGTPSSFFHGDKDAMKRCLWDCLQLGDAAALVPQLQRAFAAGEAVSAGSTRVAAIRKSLAWILTDGDAQTVLKEGATSLAPELLHGLFLGLQGDPEWWHTGKTMKATAKLKALEKILLLVSPAPQPSSSSSSSSSSQHVQPKRKSSSSKNKEVLSKAPPRVHFPSSTSASTDLLGNALPARRGIRTEISVASVRQRVPESESDSEEEDDLFRNVPSVERQHSQNGRRHENGGGGNGGDKPRKSKKHSSRSRRHRDDSSSFGSSDGDSSASNSSSSSSDSDDEQLSRGTRERFRGCTSERYSMAYQLTRLVSSFASVEQYVQQRLAGAMGTRNLHELHRWAVLLDELSRAGVHWQSVPYEFAARIFYALQMADKSNDYECVNRFIGRQQMGLPEFILRDAIKSQRISDSMQSSSSKSRQAKGQKHGHKNGDKGGYGGGGSGQRRPYSKDRGRRGHKGNGGGGSGKDKGDRGGAAGGGAATEK
jgi:hypothetical protein